MQIFLHADNENSDQADVSLRLANMSKCTFSHVMVHSIFRIQGGKRDENTHLSPAKETGRLTDKVFQHACTCNIVPQLTETFYDCRFCTSDLGVTGTTGTCIH